MVVITARRGQARVVAQPLKSLKFHASEINPVEDRYVAYFKTLEPGGADLGVSSRHCESADFPGGRRRYEFLQSSHRRQTVETHFGHRLATVATGRI